MPALSPTMEHGGIAAWTLKEGDEITAGNPVCEIETDKATVDFEAQDDGFLAKILVQAGASEVAVGTPIGVMVEDASQVDAFKSYSPADAGASAPAATPKPEQPASGTAMPKQESKPEQPAPPAPPAPTPTAALAPKPVQNAAPAAPAPPQSAAATAPKPAAATASSARPVAPAYPAFRSPLKAVFERQQAEYEAKYGHTMMRRAAK